MAAMTSSWSVLEGEPMIRAAGLRVNTTARHAA
jgi:hypothetical protein